jgi:hypothetical protein
VALGNLNRETKELITRILYHYAHTQGEKKVRLKIADHEESLSVMTSVNDEKLEKIRISA